MRAASFTNRVKTLGLFVLMWALLMAIGGAIAGWSGNSTWLWGFAAIGLFSTFYTYWNSAELALKQMRAYPVNRQQAPALHSIVEELSRSANMPMPSIWIAPTENPNAFATGRNPNNAAVCCTEGILKILDERELKGVLGHELSHVYNRDILTASVAAAMAGIITTVAQFSLLFGGGRGEGGSQGAGLGALIAALFAPLIATVVQLGISRTREYDADLDGAKLTGDPMGLASALAKIDAISRNHPLPKTPDTESAAAMMIANPFKGGAARNLFATHPPMEDRIARLQRLQQQMNGQ